MPSKPTVFIEHAGLPAAGKTTTAGLLLQFYESNGLHCTIIPEAAASSPLSHLKRDWRFNAWTMCHAILGILESNAENRSRIVILDRGLFDVLCWLKWFKRTDTIPADVFNTLNSLVLVDDWFKKLDSIIVLRATYDTALKRRGESGRIVNPQTMLELRHAYDEVIEHSTEHLSTQSLNFIDTDHLSPTEVTKRVVDILEPLIIT